MPDLMDPPDTIPSARQSAPDVIPSARGGSGIGKSTGRFIPMPEERSLPSAGGFQETERGIVEKTAEGNTTLQNYSGGALRATEEFGARGLKMMSGNDKSVANRVANEARDAEADVPVQGGAASTLGQLTAGGLLNAPQMMVNPAAVPAVMAASGAIEGAGGSELDNPDNHAKALGHAILGAITGYFGGKGFNAAGSIESTAGRLAANAGIGGVTGAVQQAGSNVIEGKPILENVGSATAMGAGQQAIMAGGGEVVHALAGRNAPEVLPSAAESIFAVPGEGRSQQTPPPSQQPPERVQSPSQATGTSPDQTPLLNRSSQIQPAPTDLQSQVASDALAVSPASVTPQFDQTNILKASRSDQPPEGSAGRPVQTPSNQISQEKTPDDTATPKSLRPGEQVQGRLEARNIAGVPSRTPVGESATPKQSPTQGTGVLPSVGEIANQRGDTATSPDATNTGSSETIADKNPSGVDRSVPSESPSPPIVAASGETVKASDVLPSAKSTNDLPPKSETIAAVHGEDPKVFSPKHEDLERNAKVLGIDGLPSRERLGKQQAIDEALKQGIPDKAVDIAHDLMQNPRPLDPIEKQGLNIQRARIDRKYTDLTEQMRLAKGTPEELTINVQRKRLAQDDELLMRALHRSGSEAGAALQSQQQAVDSTESLVATKSAAKIAKGSELTSAEESKIEMIHAQLKETNLRLEKMQQQMNDKQATEVLRQGRARVSKDRSGIIADRTAKLRALLDAGCE